MTGNDCQTHVFIAIQLLEHLREFGNQLVVKRVVHFRAVELDQRHAALDRSRG